jgi:hypothetical protein
MTVIDTRRVGLGFSSRLGTAFCCSSFSVAVPSRLCCDYNILWNYSVLLATCVFVLLVRECYASHS